jgi:hypothetical protein
MESLPYAILTLYNYFEWKKKMDFFIRGRGLYRFTMAMEKKPTSAIEKSKYIIRMNEACGALCIHMSPELLFHVSTCKSPNEIWTTMEGLFGKQYEMRGHMFEVKLLALDSEIFENIQDFFTRYKDLLLQFKVCRVDKSKEEK